MYSIATVSAESGVAIVLGCVGGVFIDVARFWNERYGSDAAAAIGAPC
jgi:hypothetical protein